MSTLVVKPIHVATGTRFTNSMLYMMGGRSAYFWRDFHGSKKATSEQQAKWQIEPHGYAIYWDELDDGIEIDQLLEQE